MPSDGLIKSYQFETCLNLLLKHFPLFREALETSLLENEELHTSLSMEKEEKGLVERERDNLREMAEQAEELAKIVKSLVTEETEGEGDTTNEEADSTNDEADATNEEA